MKWTRLGFMGALILSVQAHGAVDPAHWMRDLSKTLADKSLNSIFIPGSHDAGTYAISASSPACPGNLSPLITTVSRWGTGPLALLSITQHLDVLGQLNLGVRFFDLRICKFQGDFWISHGQISYTTKNIFEAVRAFTHSFPNEIVILQVSRFFNFLPEDHALFQKQIDSIFGSQIADEHLTPASKLKDYWQADKNVVLIYDSPLGKYWKRDRLVSPWAHSVDADYVLKFGEERNDVANRAVLRVFQAIRTPNTSSIALETVSTIPLSHSMNQTLLSNLDVLKQNQFNIVMYDNVGFKDLTKRIIELNGE